ncbi:MAG: histone deacetylase family protein, partial [Hyphomicrobiaceae bacterium]
MKLFFSNRQLQHAPQQFMSAGRIVAPFEIPERAERMARGLSALGLELVDPDDFGLAPILEVHADHYVDFLRSAYDRYQELPNAGPEVLPNVHPHIGAYVDLGPRERPRPTHIVGQTGWYIGDLACALGRGTWDAVYASAQS